MTPPITQKFLNNLGKKALQINKVLHRRRARVFGKIFIPNKRLRPIEPILRKAESSLKIGKLEEASKYYAKALQSCLTVLSKARGKPFGFFYVKKRDISAVQDLSKELNRARQKSLFNKKQKPKPQTENLKATNLESKFDALKNKWLSPYQTVFPEEELKKALIEKLRKDLDQFVESDSEIVFQQHSKPTVSIVIAVHNKPELLLRCLQCVQEHADVPFEVIIWDDCSKEDMEPLYRKIKGANIVRSKQNLNYVRVNNEAAKLANGSFLLLLNTDAFIRQQAVSSSVKILNEHEKIAVVGGLLVLPNGKVQEAGNTIWSNASCAGYGRGLDPDSLHVSFVKVVDYCSGAFFLIKKKIWEEMGGFEIKLAPAYYEETELCIRLRKAGYCSVYNPLAVIDHYEFGSMGTSYAVKQMETNREFVLRTHTDYLEKCAKPGNWAEEYTTRPKKIGRPRVLYIDDSFPYYSLGAGFPRLRDILVELSGFEFEVVFLGRRVKDSDRNCIDLPWVQVIEADGVEEQQALMRQLIPSCQTVIVSRPHNKKFLDDAIAGLYETNAISRPIIIYDAEAIFSERETYKHRVIYGHDMPSEQRQELYSKELKLAKDADGIITVTKRDENCFLSAYPNKRTVIIGHALQIQQSANCFIRRNGLLFVGPLAEEMTPNSDGMFWFLDHVAPLIWQQEKLRIDIVGRVGVRRLYEYLSSQVVSHGAQRSLLPFYERAKVFICPTRFAAGMPYKIAEAMAHGVPIVCTTLISSQMDLVHEKHVLIADTKEEFAAQVLRLHRDEDLWNQLRNEGMTLAKNVYSWEKLRQSCEVLKNWISLANINS